MLSSPALHFGCRRNRGPDLWHRPQATGTLWRLEGRLSLTSAATRVQFDKPPVSQRWPVSAGAFEGTARSTCPGIFWNASPRDNPHQHCWSWRQVHSQNAGIRWHPAFSCSSEKMVQALCLTKLGTARVLGLAIPGMLRCPVFSRRRPE